ncbi:helix-turn-helix domain-containing protein [Kitasatospora sp. NPDC002551]|uniref:helix-turn-helix domain-containing protein n=1 Tax=Kitasatospora sp. NPDC002551 TaxID=3154539 RepID=UPI00332CF6D1
MRQERAQQTHRTLLRAAATEFDRHGYAGTSLARVSQSAGVTMGALTFHFPSKAALADAVRAQATALTRAAVARTSGADGQPGAGVAELLDTLTRLLEEEPSVRAAARLTWEQPESAGNWHAGWSPDLRDRLARERAVGAGTGTGLDDTVPDSTGPDGARPDSTGPDGADLEVLAHCLVVGAEALRRGVVTLDGDDPAERAEVHQRLGRLWRRAVAGPPAPGAPR